MVCFHLKVWIVVQLHKQTIQILNILEVVLNKSPTTPATKDFIPVVVDLLEGVLVAALGKEKDYFRAKVSIASHITDIKTVPARSQRW